MSKDATKINENLERLFLEIERIGKIPYDSKKTSCRNNLITLKALYSDFADECVEAFRNGMRFS